VGLDVGSADRRGDNVDRRSRLHRWCGGADTLAGVPLDARLVVDPHTEGVRLSCVGILPRLDVEARHFERWVLAFERGDSTKDHFRVVIRCTFPVDGGVGVVADGERNLEVVDVSASTPWVTTVGGGTY
jgi:hypothetical protein